MNVLWTKIEATLIYQKRYFFFLKGLENTLILTLLSFLFAVLIGLLLCSSKRSPRTAISRAAGIISYALVEIPTLVLLMVFAYIVFAGSDIPIIMIAIIALALKEGAYLSAIFQTALETVAPGEIEAARTLGMNKWQAFRYVCLPQATAVAMPLCRNQFVGTLQETSVVGYLAIMDLTRASSVVAARTMDAFFGLFIVTLAYFAIGAIIKGLMSLLTKDKNWNRRA